jgi:hypothetical protein
MWTYSGAQKKTVYCQEIVSFSISRDELPELDGKASNDAWKSGENGEKLQTCSPTMLQHSGGRDEIERNALQPAERTADILTSNLF